MKVLSVAVVLLSLSTSAQVSYRETFSRPEPPRVTSPVIDADRRVTFAVRAPKASEVLLTGEFLNGSTNLQKNDEGTWSITLGPIAPEIYNYNLTIDGVRTIDPGNALIKYGSTPVTIGSVLEVRGERPAFYDVQAVPHGEIRTHWYESKSLDSIRRLTVYTPPGYDAARRTRYPVLYLLHGANGDEDVWHRLGRANVILDNLLADKKVRPFLIVMPFGYGVKPGTSAAAGQNTPLFQRDLLEDVIPYVESRYRTYPDRDRRALIGLSMGGGQALSIGLNHLDRFSYVGGFGSGLGNATNWPSTYGSVIADPKKANARLNLLWISCGRDDNAFRASKNFCEFLTQHNVKHVFHESDGAHTWIVWRRDLHAVAPLLFRR